jgi:hypothetical protein
MTTANDTFIQHTEDILAVARRLLSRGVILYVYECNAMLFGSWLVVAGRKHERFQFCWDGRALSLTISRSVRVDLQRQWEPIHNLNVRHPEAISAMEAFLNEQFSFNNASH